MHSLEKYCIEKSVLETEILNQITKFTKKNEEAFQMLSGPIVGNFLNMLIKISNAKNILEIGMFTGYSALNMAQALPSDGEIHTCENMARHIENAQLFFNQSRHKEKIFIHKGDALEILEKFHVNSFDFVFIDADKINYIEYYQKSMHLVKSGGIIVLDNMLWGGGVLNPLDEQSKVLHALADIIQKDTRNINSLFPIRDGLMVCYKK